MAVPQGTEGGGPCDPPWSTPEPSLGPRFCLDQFLLPSGLLPIMASLLFSACDHAPWEETVEKTWPVLPETGAGRVVDIIPSTLKWKALGVLYAFPLRLTYSVLPLG